VAGGSVDVLIPTLGRPDLLRAVLEDLSSQTILPRRVHIVDQRPLGASPAQSPELAGSWPFEVEHFVVPWQGVCRARNLALAHLDGEWVLMLDDDVRLPARLLESLLATAQSYGVEVLCGAVRMSEGELKPPAGPRPWPHLAAGVCLLSRRARAAAGGFDERCEGGFGEDYEYGIRLRRAGFEVAYVDDETVLHLKAASGGFRQPHPQPWAHDEVAPRPYPTVLYSRRKHLTPAMLDGYRLFYTLNRFRAVAWYRRGAELMRARREWRRAWFWSQHLLAQGRASQVEESPGANPHARSVVREFTTGALESAEEGYAR
jgi:glycosyltransferase involved in cell wall biosynthesis